MNYMRYMLVLLVAVILSGCTDADIASQNISTDADMFRIDRRIVFINGITDNYIMSIEGRCSIYDDGNQLEVVCKTGEGEFKKHFLGLSDNVTYMAEHLEPSEVSTSRYKVIFKPVAIVPDVEFAK